MGLIACSIPFCLSNVTTSPCVDTPYSRIAQTVLLFRCMAHVIARERKSENERVARAARSRRGSTSGAGAGGVSGVYASGQHALGASVAEEGGDTASGPSSRPGSQQGGTTAGPAAAGAPASTAIGTSTSLLYRIGAVGWSYGKHAWNTRQRRRRNAAGRSEWGGSESDAGSVSGVGSSGQLDLEQDVSAFGDGERPGTPLRREGSQRSPKQQRRPTGSPVAGADGSCGGGGGGGDSGGDSDAEMFYEVEEGLAPKQPAVVMTSEDWDKLDKLIGVGEAAAGAARPGDDSVEVALTLRLASWSLELALTGGYTPTRDWTGGVPFPYPPPPDSTAFKATEEAAEAPPAAAPSDPAAAAAAAAAAAKAGESVVRVQMDGLTSAIRLYPFRREVDMSMHWWNVETPEGPLLQSDREGDSASADATGHAFSAKYLNYLVRPQRGVAGAGQTQAAAAAADERPRHKLHAALRPIYVTLTRSVLSRMTAWGRAAVEGTPGDTTALEAAAAEAAAAARRLAQERLALELANAPRLELELDVAAPKVALPIRWATAREGRPSHAILLDFGHFTLRSLGQQPLRGAASPLFTRGADGGGGGGGDAAAQPGSPAASAGTAETFVVRVRDVETFFAEPHFTWDGVRGSPQFDPARSLKDNVAACDPSLRPLVAVRRIAFDARVAFSPPTAPPTQPRISVRMMFPELGMEVTPVRYWRMMDGMREFLDELTPPPLKPWLRESALKAQGDVLTPGAIRPSWAPRHVAHHGAYVYVLEGADAPTYLSSYRLGRGTRVAAVAPERVGGAENVVAVFDANVPLSVAAESRRALLLRLEDAAGARAWLSTLHMVNRRLTETTTQAFAPGLMTDLLSLDDYGAESTVTASPAAQRKSGDGGRAGDPSSPSGAGPLYAEPPLLEAVATDVDRTGMSIVAEVGALNMLIGGSAAVVPSAPPRPQWGAPGEILLLRWQGRLATVTWQSARTHYSCSMALRQLRVEDALCGGLFLTSSAAAVDGARAKFDPLSLPPTQHATVQTSLSSTMQFPSTLRTHSLPISRFPSSPPPSRPLPRVHRIPPQRRTRATINSSTLSSPFPRWRTPAGAHPRRTRRRRRRRGWRR